MKRWFQTYYGPLLGNRDFAMTAFQTSYTAGSLATAVEDWRARSAAAGHPWVISVDEPQGIENDATDDTLDTLQYFLDAAPAGMTINADSGVISWTPLPPPT